MNSVIYCEGYQDRAFLSAWIDRLAEREGRAVVAVKDKAARRLKIEPAHVKQSGKRQVTIVAGEGDSDLAERAELLVRKWNTQVDRLVLVVDADRRAASERQEQLSAAFRARAPDYSGKFSVLVWDPQLEVLIEQALRKARPAPLESIDSFLLTAPGRSETRKEAAFTFCSAWEPDWFGETFFQQVWRTDDVRGHLEEALKALEPTLLALL